ncbi:threonine ammonia-lyase [Aestuariispira ectoiniformans]|uniref:threonine ammonia-lyase n=1 Tax=Aestuariispira ectoiniformans TaxID=2775080 RepID=UPI00223B96C0|nr:threonine ammonia-lyase [Aestuariispira ectoiniformans]
MSVTIDDILAAQKKVSPFIQETRQRKAQTLSHITGANVFLKFENRQFTASFKERGALNKLLSLTDAEKKAGVIAMSAGNHAQGVAYHASRLGIPATIVMPTNTPMVKVERTEEHGATVVLHGDVLAESAAFAHQMGEDKGYTFIHPYDDPYVIAGQGTVALEMLEGLPNLDALVVPIGGGGLISGCAIAAKAIKPDIEIYGVQSELYASMHDILAGREPVCGGSTIAEGIAVKYPGEITRKIVREQVEEILLVGEGDLENAVSLLAGIEKTVAEGAGAAGLAAMIKFPDRFKGKNVGLIVSGGNIDQRLLATVLMRDLVRQGRLARLRISLSDRTGELARVSSIIGENGGNIVEVSHQRVFTHVSAKDTCIEVALETRDEAQLHVIVGKLEAEGYPVQLL